MPKAGICNFIFVLLKLSKTPFQISVNRVYSSFINFLSKRFVLGGAQASDELLNLSSISFTVNLPLQKYIFP